MNDWKKAYRLIKQPSGMITLEDRITGEMAHFTPHNPSRNHSPRMGLLYRLLYQLHEIQEEEANHHDKTNEGSD